MCLQTPLRLACDLMNSFQWLCKGLSRFCREMTLAVLSLHLPPRLSDGGLENPPEGHLVHVAAPWGPQEGGAIQVDQEYPHSLTLSRSMWKARNALHIQYTEQCVDFLKYPVKTRGFSF